VVDGIAAWALGSGTFLSKKLAAGPFEDLLKIKVASIKKCDMFPHTVCKEI
jgi:hypothetical protein